MMVYLLGTRSEPRKQAEEPFMCWKSHAEKHKMRKGPLQTRGKAAHIIMGPLEK